jgi:hypothetical protein
VTLVGPAEASPQRMRALQRTHMQQRLLVAAEEFRGPQTLRQARMPAVLQVPASNWGQPVQPCATPVTRGKDEYRCGLVIC